jgi:predicted transcriptional regulator
MMDDTPMSEESSDLDLDRIRWQETLEAIESVAQGRVVPGEAVHAWLSSWGSPDELPPPSC